LGLWIMRHRVIFLLIFSVCSLAACVTTQSSPPKSLTFSASTDTFTHEASGFVFPAAIGRFQRDKDIKFYGTTGNDFSVPYNLVTPNEKVVGTVYIYPSLRDYSITPVPQLGRTPDWFLQNHYDEVKAYITARYRARILSESDYSMDRSILNAKGKKAIFEWDTVGGETVQSHLYLFAHKGWLVKYRFTYLSKYEHEVEPEIKRFLNLFQWP